MKRFLLMVVVMFSLYSFAGYALADSIWIDTSAEALREAERSIAIQMLKADYSADRIYGGVDAVIHFSASGKDYVLYHALDNYSGCFVLSTFGTEPYPYNTFGGEENAEATAFHKAEDAAKDAYFALKNGDLGDEQIPVEVIGGLATLTIAGVLVIHKKRQGIH
ncbi:MAG: hypothetical protein IJ089_00690 [Clostridia bacterium]|nr:hypothetical protein [Clostridia bacterium]